MLGVSHEEAVEALRSVGDELMMMVCDGFDPALINDQSSSNLPPMARMESTSSIDRDPEPAPPMKRV